MSGIEIALIIGAGYLITKKVKEHRHTKKQNELRAAGLLPEEPQQQQPASNQTHGVARLTTNRRREAGEEDLPAYSKETTSGGFYGGTLPSYDDVRKQGTEGSAMETEQTVPVSTANGPNGRSIGVVNECGDKKVKSKKWKLWTRNSTAKEEGQMTGTTATNAAPVTQR